MTKRWGSILVGLGLAAATGIALPVLLGAKSNGEDLTVKVATDRPYELLAAPQAARALVEFEPKDVSAQHLLREGESGLNLTTWSKTYGGSYVREVTWPTLTGPFHPENDFVCGYSLQLGAGLFDTSGAGAGLQRLVHEKLAQIFPLTNEVEAGIVISLPALESSTFRIVLASGAVLLALHLRLVDKSTLEARLPVRMVVRNDLPTIERIPNGQLDVAFEGPSRDRIVEQAKALGGGWGGLGGCALGAAGGPLGLLFGCLGGYVFGSNVAGDEAQLRIPEKSRTVVGREVDKVLAQFALGLGRIRGPFRPFKDRPGDEICLRLDGDPAVDPLGITLPLCVRITAAEPQTDSTVPGPVALGGGRIPHGQLVAMAPVIGLTLNGDATNQLVHYVWQAGLLKSVGESTLVLDALSDSVRRAAFDFTGFAPGLPPTLAPSLANGQGLPFVMGDVKVGVTGDKSVVAHGVAMLDLVEVGDSIELGGRLDDLHVNCVSKRGSRIPLHPCMSDLLPVVRDMMAHGKRPSYRFSGTDLLNKLPQFGFHGLQVNLSGLRIASVSGPLGISMTANARVE